MTTKMYWTACLLVAALAGCADDPDTTTASEATEDARPRDANGRLLEVGDRIDPALLPAASEDDVGIPGEDPNVRDKAVDRVYIQWCDRPNSSEGTVCRIYDNEFSSDPSINEFDECRRDARRVCGSPVQYFVLYERTGRYYAGN